MLALSPAFRSSFRALTNVALCLVSGPMPKGWKNTTNVIKEAATVNQNRANAVMAPEKAEARREHGARMDMKNPRTLKTRARR